MRHVDTGRQDPRLTVYEPNQIIKLGIRAWPHMVRALVDYRALIWRFFVRNISIRYKQSFLGLFWTFVAPLIMTVVFVWAKSRNILPIRDTVMPYVAFVFLGQIVWLLFSQAVALSSQSLVAVGPMLTKVSFPKEVLIVSAVLHAIFEFLLRIPLLVAILVWVGFQPNAGMLAIPLVLVPLVLLSTGLGFILALLNAVVRDIGHIVGITLNVSLFATPVIYPPPESHPLGFLINHVNPVSAFVTATRDLATTGTITCTPALISSSLFGFLVFFCGWRIFYLAESKIAERI